MARYYFHVVAADGRGLISDSEGVVFSSLSAARNRAVGLAREIVKNGVVNDPIEKWRIVVTQENGEQVFSVPFSEISARNSWTRLHLRELLAKCKQVFSLSPADRFAATAGLGIAIQGALIAILMVANQATTYQTASAPADHCTVAVRFVPNADPMAIGEFLDRYKAAVISTPRPGGLYRLRMTERDISNEELAAILSRMMQEKVVELAAAVE